MHGDGGGGKGYCRWGTTVQGEMAEALEEEEMECCGCDAVTDVLASRQVGNKQGLQEQNHAK